MLTFTCSERFFLFISVSVIDLFLLLQSQTEQLVKFPLNKTPLVRICSVPAACLSKEQQINLCHLSTFTATLCFVCRMDYSSGFMHILLINLDQVLLRIVNHYFCAWLQNGFKVSEPVKVFSLFPFVYLYKWGFLLLFLLRTYFWSHPFSWPC